MSPGNRRDGGGSEAYESPDGVAGFLDYRCGARAGCSRGAH